MFVYLFQIVSELSKNVRFVLALYIIAFQGNIVLSQCTTPAVGPATPTGGFFRPTCVGGNDGRVRISGINSSSGANINATYSVRRLTAIGGTPIGGSFAVALGQTSLDIPGFSAGTYFFDVIDQCGNTSADISVTIPNPSPYPTTLLPNGIVFNSNLSGGSCGDVVRFRTAINIPFVDDNHVLTYTNHLGATFTTTETTIQNVNQGGVSTRFFQSDIPLSFFDSQPLTAVLSSSCGSTSAVTVPFPGSTFIIHKFANPATPTELQDIQVSSGCNKGYRVNRQSWNGVNIIDVVIEETAYPGVTPIGFEGNLLTPYGESFVYKPSPPNVIQGTTATSTDVPYTGGLKYNTNYTITYTDDCGRVFSENVFRTDPTPTLTIQCLSNGNTMASPYVDDLIGMRFVSSTGNFNFLSNPVLTALSGPATFTTQSGGVATTHTITYPFNVEYSIVSVGAPNVTMNFYLPPGSYNLQLTDDCGHNSAYTIGSSCPTYTSEQSITLNYCAAATPGNANLTISPSPGGIPNTRWRLYNASNVLLFSGLGQSSLSTVKPNLPPGTYYLRYGGVNVSTGAPIEPSYIDPSTPLPRFFGNFIYEKVIVIPTLSPLSFQSISACSSDISMLGTGGVEPYEYSVLDAAGNVLLYGPQVFGNFSGLTYGTTYTGNVKDACGSEFNQVFTVASPSTPISSITGPLSSMCPNTSTTLTAEGGTTGYGAILNWYTGPSGTGTLLGSGNTLSVAPNSTTTYYARREGVCNITPDASYTVSVKTYIYADDGTVTSDYCTDNNGWHHFYVGDEIILSCQGDLTGVQSGYPIARINKNSTYYQSGIGPNSPIDCTNNLTPGEERFEMRRSWNLNVGGGSLIPPYKIRFYFEEYEKSEIENGATSWMSSYPDCGYSYKYPNPLGFYWFKNVSGDYLPAQYDGTHLNSVNGVTSNGINYVELENISSFSGGSGGIILEPLYSLPVELIGFEGLCKPIERKVSLHWQTNSEYNSSHFILEKSLDGINWSKIGQVPAAVNSQSLMQYEFIDSNYQSLISYYKLLQVDLDGVLKELDILGIDCDMQQNDLKVFPNPAQDKVIVSVPEEYEKKTFSISIYDLKGRSAMSKHYLSADGNEITLDVQFLERGLYLMSFEAGEYFNEVIKFVKD